MTFSIVLSTRFPTREIPARRLDLEFVGGLATNLIQTVDVSKMRLDIWTWLLVKIEIGPPL